MAKGLQHRADNDPRAAALLAMVSVMGGADSQAALDQVLSGAGPGSGLGPSDRALATELFYGTLRHHLRLEWFLGQKLPRPEGLPEEMRLLLEQSVYELAHTRIPAHAGVNWAVELVRGRFGSGLAKVANGVLRGVERGKREEYLNRAWYAERLKAEAGSLEVEAIWHGLPVWLVRLWRESYSPATCAALCATALEPAAPGLRLNPWREDTREVADLLEEQGAKILEGTGVWLPPEKVRLPVSLWIKQGLASRQSPAAAAALEAAAPLISPQSWLPPVWDACAGRGGKTLALLERGVAVRVASDPSQGRLRGLAEDYRRLGLDVAAEKGAPALPELRRVTAQEAGFSGEFRTVLVDAPCSGLGTLAHRPEIRWRRNMDDVARLAAAQAEILEAAHRALIPEGASAIVYLTCTMTRMENQERTAAFLARHPEYELGREYETPPESGYGEFFYSALLRRK